MSEHDTIIKYVRSSYNDLPIGIVDDIERIVEALLNLEVKCDNQHTQIVDLVEALKFARKRIAYYGAIGPRRHFDHDLAEVYPKIDAALSLSGDYREETK